MKSAKKPMLPPFLMKGADKAKAKTKGKKYAKGGGVEIKGKTRGRVC